MTYVPTHLPYANEHEHTYVTHYLPVMKVDTVHQLHSTHYRGTQRYALKLCQCVAHALQRDIQVCSKVVR